MGPADQSPSSVPTPTTTESPASSASPTPTTVEPPTASTSAAAPEPTPTTKLQGRFERLTRFVGLHVEKAVPVLPFLVMLLAGLRGSRSFGLSDDEHCTWWAVHLPYADYERLLGHVDAVFGPYYLFLRLWTSLFGDSEFSLRLPSILAMAAAAGLVAQLGKRIGGAAMGLFAGLFVATIPTLSIHAHNARPYAFAVAAGVAATLLFLRAMERPDSIGRWIAYGVSVAFITSAHFVTLCILFAHLVMTLDVKCHAPWLSLKKGWWRWGFACALGLLVMSPLLYQSALQSKQLRVIPVTSDTLKALLTQLTGTRPLTWVLLGASAVALLRRRPLVVPLLVWSILPPLLLYVTYPVLHIFRDRYFLFTLPAWSLLAAAGLTSLPWRTRWVHLVPTLGLIALLATGSEAQEAKHDYSAQRHAPYRLAGDILHKYAKRGDGIVYGRTGGGLYHERLGLAYAMGDEMPLRDILVKKTAASRGQFQAEECRPADSCVKKPPKRLWLLAPAKRGHKWGELAPDKQAFIESRYTLRRKWRLGKRTLYLFTVVR